VQRFPSGGCWPNPGGPATYGWTVEDGDGQVVASGSGRVPERFKQTAPVADYCAVIALLEHVHANGIPLREVWSDSELAVHQVAGDWRCKAPHLAELRGRVRDRLDGAAVTWLPREQNERAGALARQAYAEASDTTPTRPTFHVRDFAAEHAAERTRCPRCGYTLWSGHRCSGRAKAAAS